MSMPARAGSLAALRDGKVTTTTKHAAQPVASAYKAAIPLLDADVAEMGAIVRAAQGRLTLCVS
jgi:hypothetical protein